MRVVNGKAVNGRKRAGTSVRHRRARAVGLTRAQRRRVRVAALTLAVVCGGLMLLESRSVAENTAETTTAAEHLIAGDTADLVDPLSLVDSDDGIFKLVGVSKDGTVIGYASTEPVAQTCLRLKDALGADGWSLDSDNAQGVLSFCRAEPGAYFESNLFVQCVAVGQGSSLVVKRW